MRFIFSAIAFSLMIGVPGNAQSFPEGVKPVAGELSPLGYWKGEARCNGKKEEVSVGLRQDWRTGNLILGIAYEPNSSYEIRSQIAVTLNGSEKYGIFSYDPTTRSGSTLPEQRFPYLINRSPKLDADFSLDSETGILTLKLKNIPGCDPIPLGRTFRELPDGTSHIRSRRINENEEWFSPSWEVQATIPIVDGAGQVFERSSALITEGYIGGASLQVRPKKVCDGDTAYVTLSSPFVSALRDLPTDQAAVYLDKYLGLNCPSATVANVEFRLRSQDDAVTGPVTRYMIGSGAVFSIPPLGSLDPIQASIQAASRASELSGTRMKRIELANWMDRTPEQLLSGTDFVGRVRELDRLGGLQLPDTWASPCAPEKVGYAETNRYRFRSKSHGLSQHTAGFFHADWDCEDYEVSLLIEADQTVPDDARDSWNGKDPVFGLSYSCVLDKKEDLIQFCMANPSDADRSNFEENACIPARSTRAAGIKTCFDPVGVHRAAQANRRDFATYQSMQLIFDGFARSVLSHSDNCRLEPQPTTGAGGRPVVLGYREVCN
jgi:hypothetical protein